MNLYGLLNIKGGRKILSNSIAIERTVAQGADILSLILLLILPHKEDSIKYGQISQQIILYRDIISYKPPNSEILIRYNHFISFNQTESRLSIQSPCQSTCMGNITLARING